MLSRSRTTDWLVCCFRSFCSFPLSYFFRCLKREKNDHYYFRLTMDYSPLLLLSSISPITFRLGTIFFLPRIIVPRALERSLPNFTEHHRTSPKTTDFHEFSYDFHTIFIRFTYVYTCILLFPPLSVSLSEWICESFLLFFCLFVFFLSVFFSSYEIIYIFICIRIRI